MKTEQTVYQCDNIHCEKKVTVPKEPVFGNSAVADWIQMQMLESDPSLPHLLKSKTVDFCSRKCLQDYLFDLDGVKV